MLEVTKSRPSACRLRQGIGYVYSSFEWTHFPLVCFNFTLDNLQHTWLVDLKGIHRIPCRRIYLTSPFEGHIWSFQRYIHDPFKGHVWVSHSKDSFDGPFEGLTRPTLGYTLVTHPKGAHFWLLLRMHKSDPFERHLLEENQITLLEEESGRRRVKTKE